ncbi:response regulator transcription factor [Paraburkholderia caribensis]|uniref:response regulator transcription factor n=1 Tax=Paraburkholderia caribensis TaxID=75105 RepID=UPI001590F2B6|nr:response regulator [Paraburkholderia caribensis]
MSATQTYPPDAKVLIVDDDRAMRDGLSNLFRSVALQVHTFSTPTELIAFECSPSPTCLVLDVRLPGQSGLALHQTIVGSAPEMPVVFISGYADTPTAVSALKAGAIDFLDKPFQELDLLSAVGRGLQLSHERLEHTAIMSILTRSFEKLTHREREIMALLSTGLRNKHIGMRLGLSEVTVKMHRANVMRKLEIESLVDLVRIADALGMHHWDQVHDSHSPSVSCRPNEGLRLLTASKRRSAAPR